MTSGNQHEEYVHKESKNGNIKRMNRSGASEEDNGKEDSKKIKDVFHVYIG